MRSKLQNCYQGTYTVSTYNTAAAAPVAGVQAHHNPGCSSPGAPDVSQQVFGRRNSDGFSQVCLLPAPCREQGYSRTEIH